MRTTPTLLAIAVVSSMALTSVFLESVALSGLFATAGTIAQETSQNATAAATEHTDNDNYNYATALDYSWLGFTWVPPLGVPFYPGSEMRRLFATENTLWVGDSTGRQDYQTAYAVVNADDPDNVNLGSMRANINKNKAAKISGVALEIPVHCPNRMPPANPSCVFPCSDGIRFMDLGQVKGTDDHCVDVDTSDRDIGNGNDVGNGNGIGIGSGVDADDHNGTRNDADVEMDVEIPVDGEIDVETNVDRFGIGKFDYSDTDCFNELDRVLQNATAATILRKDYSVVIVSLGMHEILGRCEDGNTNITSSERLVGLLDDLRALSGPSLLVVWKTHGPSANEEEEGGRRTRAINNMAREWFATVNPEHMDIADVETIVMGRNRAFGKDRNRGDLAAHWGTETRTLGIQLMCRAIHLNRERTHRSGAN
mmetsp:Transcript_4872/g.11883  ORF Transcript_4872/g.11883 Transcript_4872/m.11883 type:complete len:425 (+) Transcript_4872:150-1424(+)